MSDIPYDYGISLIELGWKLLNCLNNICVTTVEHFSLKGARNLFCHEINNQYDGS